MGCKEQKTEQTFSKADVRGHTGHVLTLGALEGATSSGAPNPPRGHPSSTEGTVQSHKSHTGATCWFPRGQCSGRSQSPLRSRSEGLKGAAPAPLHRCPDAQVHRGHLSPSAQVHRCPGALRPPELLCTGAQNIAHSHVFLADSSSCARIKPSPPPHQ